MKAITPRIRALLAAGAAMLLAACGSSGTNNTTTSSTSSTNSTVSGGGAEASATTPCTTAQFGSAMQPKDAPSNVHSYAKAPSTQIDSGKLYLVTIKTKRGDIALCLQPKLAPVTVNNFVVLARNHFFDGLTFHRVVANFVIQGGDPKGDGTGGPGYEFADEPVQGAYTTGCVAMANAGPNTNGSQFFICTHDDTQLPKAYNLFGQVTGGMNVALQVQQGDVMNTVTVQEQS
jgi:cyclophilin family peptidyl-prolyl cis-trans isomerase